MAAPEPSLLGTLSRNWVGVEQFSRSTVSKVVVRMPVSGVDRLDCADAICCCSRLLLLLMNSTLALERPLDDEDARKVESFRAVSAPVFVGEI